MAGIGDRLRKKRIERGFDTAADAARSHGWNANTYRSHENEFRGVPRKWLLTYAKAYGVSLSWLTTGVEERRQTAQSGSDVPILDWATLPTKRGGSMDLAATVGEVGTVHVNRKVPKGTSALPVKDDSMIDPQGSRWSLYPGDTVILEQEFRLRPGHIALIYDAHDKQHLFRRAEFSTRSIVRFVALNPIHPTIEMPPDSPYIIAVVTEVIRKMTPNGI